MKTIIYFLLILAINLNANSQGLASFSKYPPPEDGVNFDLQREIINNYIPEIPVENLNGKTTTLATFIKKNIKYVGKPILLVTTNSFCNRCIQSIKNMSKKGLAEKYNIIVIYEITDTRTDDGLKEFINKKEFNKEYPDLLFVKTTQGNSAKYLITNNGTPLFLIADSNLRSVYSSLGYDDGSIETVLELVENQLTTREKISYDKLVKVVPNNDKNAYYTYEFTENDNKRMVKMFVKNKLINNISYIFNETTYLFDGIFESNYITYDEDSNIVMKPASKIEYKEGVPTKSYTSYYANGQKETVYPLNGTLLSYDEEGMLVTTGPVKDGLGDGVYKKYNKGLLIHEFSYEKGVLNGPYTSYQSGVVITKGFYKDNEYYGLQKDYDKEGSIVFETWRSINYTEVGKFANELAFVKKDGRYGYINKKGEEVIPIQYDEAKEFKNGFAKVTINGKEFYINKFGEKSE